jgi:double zinc ribbon protein
MMLSFPLRCPSCDHGNPVGANFCNNCGVPVDLEACAYCDAVNRRGADRCHKCGRLLALLHELQSRRAAALADTRTSPSEDETIVDRDDELRLDAYKATIDGRGAGSPEGAEERVERDEALAARSAQRLREDLAAAVARQDPASDRKVVAKRRTPGMRAAAMGVMLIALALPGYIAYQDPAQFRESIEAIAPRSDALSAILQPAEPAQTMPVDDPTARPPESPPLPPAPQAADATVEPPSQPAEVASETQSPPPKAEVGSKAPQAGQSPGQTRNKSGASGGKQGGSSRKVAKPRASDTRPRAKSAEVRPSAPTEISAGSDVMP